jgi:hypothetical protein
VFSHWPLADWSNKEEGSLHVHGGTKQENLKGRFCANISNWNWAPIELEFLKEMYEHLT